MSIEGSSKENNDKDQRYDASGSGRAQEAKTKKPWLSAEDLRLQELVLQYGTGNWPRIADYLPDRSGKQCRERWHNQLIPGIKKVFNFTLLNCPVSCHKCSG